MRNNSKIYVEDVDAIRFCVGEGIYTEEQGKEALGSYLLDVFQARAATRASNGAWENLKKVIADIEDHLPAPVGKWTEWWWYPTGYGQGGHRSVVGLFQTELCGPSIPAACYITSMGTVRFTPLAGDDKTKFEEALDYYHKLQ